MPAAQTIEPLSRENRPRVRRLDQVPLLEAPYEGFNLVQSNTLLLASHGGTEEEIGAILGYEPGDIKTNGVIIMNALGVATMAAAAFSSIKNEVVDISNEPKVGLTEVLKPRDYDVLELIGKGLNNRQVAHVLGKNRGTFMSNVASPLFKKLRASGRTHSMLRGVVEEVI